MSRTLTDGQCSQLSELISDRMGLHFAPERWDDLRRGLSGAAEEFGFDDVSECATWLLDSALEKAQIEILATHLTIGETYFFRDKPLLRALTDTIFPALIAARRGGERRLRIWSAASCSGEEPYTLAILLHQLLPDLKDWRVTITATDINPRFLQKAAGGIYGDWSFRDAPSAMKRRYFREVSNGRYAIDPEIKSLVTFSHLNLVEDFYPSIETDTNAMDVIFCRNVMMYFTPAQMQKVVTSLRRSLVDGGWLAVSPSEASGVLFPRFVSVNFPGAIFFRKSDAPVPGNPPVPFEHVLPAVPVLEEQPLPASASLPAAFTPLASVKPWETETVESALLSAKHLYDEGRYEECTTFLAEAAGALRLPPRAFSLMAHAQANQGNLSEALRWCEQWIEAEKMNAAAHYLRAVILIERGRVEEARLSLQRTVYLEPGLVLAHFALGNLARSAGKSAPARKHFDNALELLRRLEPAVLLPESEGLTAGRLAETIEGMRETETLA